MRNSSYELDASEVVEIKSSFIPSAPTGSQLQTVSTGEQNRNAAHYDSLVQALSRLREEAANLTEKLASSGEQLTVSSAAPSATTPTQQLGSINTYVSDATRSVTSPALSTHSRETPSPRGSVQSFGTHMVPTPSDRMSPHTVVQPQRSDPTPRSALQRTPSNRTSPSVSVSLQHILPPTRTLTQASGQPLVRAPAPPPPAHLRRISSEMPTERNSFLVAPAPPPPRIRPLSSVGQLPTQRTPEIARVAAQLNQLPTFLGPRPSAPQQRKPSYPSAQPAARAPVLPLRLPVVQPVASFLPAAAPPAQTAPTRRAAPHGRVSSTSTYPTPRT